MDEPLSPPPVATPAPEGRPETTSQANRRDEEVRGCFLLCALISGVLAFSVIGPIGVVLPLLGLLPIYLVRARLFSVPANDTGTRPVGVPRRFGVGSLLVVTAAFAILLGAMKSLQVDPIGMGLVAAFVAVVGAGQAVLFGGKAPRKASMLAGMLFLLVMGLASMVWNHFPNAQWFWIFLISNVFVSVVAGVPLGYVAGVLAAGVFLAIERVWGRPKDEDGTG